MAIVRIRNGVTLTLPADARFEAQLAGGVALYDVSDLLPRHRTKRYRRRNAAKIRACFTHHSGALGRDGYEGWEAMARYCIEHRGWPGSPYTIGLNFNADRDAEGRIVVYRLQPDVLRTYHSGDKANGLGIAVVWQGNLWDESLAESEWDVDGPPSSDQWEAAEALYPWLEQRFPLITRPKGWSLHNEAKRWGGRSKKACPGPWVSDWIREWRQP